MSTFNSSDMERQQTNAPNQSVVSENLSDLQPTKSPYGIKDSIFAWITILACFLFVRALPIVENSLGGLLTVLMMFALATVYFVLSKVKVNASTVAFGITVCVLSLGLITGANPTIRRWLFFFIILAYLYYIYCASGLAGKHPLSDHSIAFAVRAIFVRPFAKPQAIFRSIFSKNTKLWRTVMWIALGLLMAIVPTAVVVLLLSYDGSFTALLNKIFFLSFKDVWGYIWDIHLGVFFSIFLFSAMFSSQWKYHTRKENDEQIRKPKTQVLPKVLLCAALTPVLVVYVIFFISQWNYYISAFSNVRPDDTTLAEYARSGFFELCWVSGINAVMLLLFRIFIRKKDGEKGIVQMIYSSLISVFTLVLIATALSKMALYINTYGLTQRRVYATWLMLLLAVVFVVVLLSQFIKKIRLVPVILVLCIVFGGIIVLPDVDGMIASYNVNAYLDGELDTVDTETLGSYGVSAVPALVDLRDELYERPQLTEDEEIILRSAEAVLSEIKIELSEQPNNFFTFNIPNARARALLE